MTDIEIKGGDDFGRLGKALRGVDFHGELSRGLASMVKPVQGRASSSASRTLPRRGGLAGLVAASRISTKISQGSNPSVSIKPESASLSPRTLAGLDAGRVVHPVFGRRPSVSQSVRPGWWSASAKAIGPDAKKELQRRIEQVVKRIG